MKTRSWPAPPFPPAASVLAVCAHPDDVSSGLGGVLNALWRAGARLSVLCLTPGEASTLGASPDLAGIRRAELHAAAVELGVSRVELLDYADGRLSEVPLARLAGDVAGTVRKVGADLLLVFDEGGVTGHPDHRRATEAALAGAGHLPVLAWALPDRVAGTLNAEFGAGFVGRDPSSIDFTIGVDREAQRRAVACHASQAGATPVLWRRLDLLGAEESLRWLRRPLSLEATGDRGGDGIDTLTAGCSAAGGDG